MTFSFVQKPSDLNPAVLDNLVSVVLPNTSQSLSDSADMADHACGILDWHRSYA